MAELRSNKVKESLSAGKIVTVPMGPMSSELIEHFGPLGVDGLWLEGEHGPVDFDNIPDLTRACDLWGMTPIVRVYQNEPAVIYRTMDLGALGICVPHINTKEEAQAVVEATKFAPIGMRGSFTSRQGIGVDDYLNKANDQTMSIILIEDIVAVNNLDEILEVNNIDIFYVAPGDLAQSMGLTGGAGSPKVNDVVDGALKKITAAGKTAGTLVSENTLPHYIDVGARFFSFSWLPWLSDGAEGILEAVEAAS